MSLKLYANFISQPSRAIAWLLKVKGVDYELVRADFGNPIFKSPEFLAMNPNGLIPVLRDEDFVLFESHAIMTYLADKFQWDDVYPKDLQARAKVNEYLHWHHLGARKFTADVVLPFFHRALGAATPAELEQISNAQTSIKKQLTLVEKFLVKDFVALTNVPTLADYSLYCEVDQLDSMALLDLVEFPKTAAWIDRMKKISFHDELRQEMNGAFKSLGLMGVGKHIEAPADATIAANAEVTP